MAIFVDFETNGLDGEITEIAAISGNIETVDTEFLFYERNKENIEKSLNKLIETLNERNEPVIFWHSFMPTYLNNNYNEIFKKLESRYSVFLDAVNFLNGYNSPRLSIIKTTELLMGSKHVGNAFDDVVDLYRCAIALNNKLKEDKATEVTTTEIKVDNKDEYDKYGNRLLTFEEFINSLKSSDVYSKYIIANAIKTISAEKIKAKDKNNKYTSSYEKEVPNDAEIAKILDNQKDKVEAIQNQLIQEAHENDWYRVQVKLPSSKSVVKKLDIDKLLEDLTLDELVEAYKSSNEALKSISNESLTPYCTEKTYKIKNEFKEAYEERKAQLYKESGCKEAKDIVKEELSKGNTITKTVSNLKLNRKPSTKDLFSEKYEEIRNEVL